MAPKTQNSPIGSSTGKAPPKPPAKQAVKPNKPTHVNMTIENEGQGNIVETLLPYLAMGFMGTNTASGGENAFLCSIYALIGSYNAAREVLSSPSVPKPKCTTLKEWETRFKVEMEKLSSIHSQEGLKGG